MKVLDAFNERGNRYKEDRLGFGENYAYVIDGATGLVDSQMPGYSSDAVWFVETIKTFLDKQLIVMSTAPSEAILKALTAHVRQQAENDGMTDFTQLAMPSAAFIMARKINQQLEVISIGDCTGVVELDTGEYEVIYDDRVSELDNQVLEVMKQIQQDQGISLMAAKPLVKDQFQKNRQLRNQPNGYRALDLTEIILDDVIQKTFRADRVRNIWLFSDGVDSYYNDFNCVAGPIGLVKAIKDQGVHRLLDQLRLAEESDPTCDRYPRLKMQDDATLIWAVGNQSG